MKALVFEDRLFMEDNMPKPVPVQREALVKVKMAGICKTDLEIEKGYMGFKGIPGHEFVGVVEESKDGDQSLLGKRVVGEINCGCKVCNYCLQGLETHCPERTTLGIDGRDGCFAEYLTLPVANLIEVPEGITNEEAVFTEPLAAAFEIMNQVHIKPSDQVCVLGDGKLGLLIALALNLSQSELLLVGKYPVKLNIAEKQHIKTALLEDLSSKRQFDLVVEATGSVDGFELARKVVRPRGKVVLKSTVAGNKELNLTSLVLDEITMIGSRCGAFNPALKALERKMLNVKPLISGIYSLDKIIEAYEASKRKDALKVLIDFTL